MKLLSAEKIGDMIASRSKRGHYFKLSQKNIYIFPTVAGFAFLLLLLVMLITAINYQNSLIYVVTFFLGAVFFFSIWMCFLNVSDLEVSGGAEQGVFEGEQGFFLVKFRKQNGEVYGLKAGFTADEMTYVPVAKNDLNEYPVKASKLKRGKHTIKRLRLESRFPFGLIKAWTWLRLDSELYVYPEPVRGVATRSESSSDKGLKSYRKTDDYNDLRNYQKGDSFLRINWKKYAASESLVVRDADFTASDATRVSWQDYEPHNKEDRLRFMCEKICRLHNDKKAFSMELPVIEIESDLGEAHFHKCLKQLATY